jgi:hypothetical protein
MPEPDPAPEPTPVPAALTDGPGLPSRVIWAAMLGLAVLLAIATVAIVVVGLLG